MALEDYGAIMQSGFNLVPDFNKQLLQQAQTNELNAEAQQQQQQAQAIQQKQARAQQFQQAFAQSDGSPEAVSRLIMQYPEFADQLKSGWDVLDKANHEGALTSLGQVYSAANGGMWDLASKQAHAMIDSYKAGGHSDPAYDQIADLIDKAAAGDTKAQATAKTMLGSMIAAKTGPDHFSATYGVMNPADDNKGQVVGRAVGHYETDADGNRKFIVDYRDPDPAEYKEVQTTDANGNPITQIVRVGGGDTGGGGPASGGAGASVPAGPDGAISHVLRHEGGYLAKDGNGYPTNFGINAKANSDELSKLHIADISAMTKPQAIQIYKDKYWPASGAANLPANLQAPYFDVYIRSPAMAKQLLAKSGGDPVTFATMAKQTFQNLAQQNPDKYGRFAKAWANRDDDNIAAAKAGAQGAQSQPASASGPGNVVFSTPSVRKAGDVPPPGNTDLSGPAYLNDLKGKNPALAAQVQGVLDTRLAYPPATARSPQAQQLRAAVLQVDPSYDEQAYKRRQETIKQYTPGHSGPGQSMLSAATLINHMYELAQAAHNLPDHSTAIQNSLSSWYAKQTNEPWLIKYNEGRKFVASELPKFLEGKAPTEGQVNEHYNSYSPSKGKSGIQTALSTDVDYLYGRYQPLLQAYKDNTGKDLNIDNYAPGQATKAKAAALEYFRANGALPAVVTNPAQAAKLPHGALFATPDGRVLRRQ